MHKHRTVKQGHGKIRLYRSRTENGMETEKEPGKKLKLSN